MREREKTQDIINNICFVTCNSDLTCVVVTCGTFALLTFYFSSGANSSFLEDGTT